MQKSCGDIYLPRDIRIGEWRGLSEGLEGPCQLGSIVSEIGLRAVVGPNADLQVTMMRFQIAVRWHHALLSGVILAVSRFRVENQGSGDEQKEEPPTKSIGKRDVPIAERRRRRNPERPIATDGSDKQLGS